jgi:hypothetical protein
MVVRGAVSCKQPKKGIDYWWGWVTQMAWGVGKASRAWKNKGKGGARYASSSWVQGLSTREKQEAEKVERQYEEKCSDWDKEEVKEVEAIVISKREKTFDAHILEEVREWVEDLVDLCTWNIKYFRIIEVDWLVKTSVAQALEKVKEDQQSIIHTLRIFEGKFKIVCSSVFGVKITVSTMTDTEANG